MSLLIVRLAPAFHNIAPDLLGFGESAHPDPAPRGIYAFGQLRAETLLTLLDELRPNRVHLVGNSMGAMIALRMAQLQPERFDRLILMGSGGAPAPFTEDLARMINFYDEPTPDAMRSLLLAFIDDTTVFAGRIDEIAVDRVAKAVRPQVRRSHLATFDLQAGPSDRDKSGFESWPYRLGSLRCRRRDRRAPSTIRDQRRGRCPRRHLGGRPRRSRRRGGRLRRRRSSRCRIRERGRLRRWAPLWR
jgi:pimeloyl-ACP methyl ester carboxylesterase